MMKYAVLGSPITHSKSPDLHRAAYGVLGLDWTYERFDVGTADLSQFLTEHADFAGFSLTMPLKEEAYRIAKANGWYVDQASTALQAGNTLKRVADGFALYNTDVYGAAEALATKPALRPRTVAVLGSGATARCVALAAMNSFTDLQRLTIFARSADAANRLFEMLRQSESFSSQQGIELIWNSLEAAGDFGGADLTINTLPSAVAADLEIDLPFTESWFFDVTYNPWPSALSELWPADHSISGIEMLIHQAIAQLRIFTAGDLELALPREPEVHAAMMAAS